MGYMPPVPHSVHSNPYWLRHMRGISTAFYSHINNK